MTGPFRNPRSFARYSRKSMVDGKDRRVTDGNTVEDRDKEILL